MDSCAGGRSGRRLGKFHARLIEDFTAFAQSEFELSAVVKEDGLTVRQHLQAAWERSGVMPAELSLALGDGLERLWSDFMALHGSRASTGFGPARIGYAEIDAYQRVIGARFEPWELDAIRAADNAYLVHYAETHKPETKH